MKGFKTNKAKCSALKQAWCVCTAGAVFSKNWTAIERGKRQIPQQIPSLPTAPLLLLPAARPRALRPVWSLRAGQPLDDLVGAEHLEHGMVLPGDLPSPLHRRDWAAATAALLTLGFFSLSVVKRLV